MTKLLFIIAHFVAFSGFSQYTDVILFTEQGEKFYLSVNGVRINDLPASRVEAFDISGEFAQINVKFEKAGAPSLSRPMMLEPGKQMTTILKRGKKGKYVFRPVSTHPIPIRQEQTFGIPVATAEASNTAPSSETTMVYVREEKEDPRSLLDLNVNENGEVNVSVNLSADISNTSYDGSDDHYDSSSSGQNHNYHSNIHQSHTDQINNVTARVEGKKIILSDGRTLDWKYTKTKSLTGVEIEMQEPIGAQVAVSYDGNLAYESDIPFFYREPDWKKSKNFFKLTVREGNGASWSIKLQHSSNNRILINNLVNSGPVTNIYEPAVGGSNSHDCYGMSDGEFSKAVASIKNKSFADEKMAIAGQILRVNCLYVTQVRTMMDLFTFEEDKIAIAKKSYARTVDQNNYYQLNDALTYSESVEELNEFLESQY